MTTLAQLTARAKARADMENSQFVQNWTDLVNNGYRRLYSILVRDHEEYFLTSANFNLVSGQEDYTLQNDFFKLKKVDLLMGGNTQAVLSVFPFQWEEMNRIRQNNFIAQTAIGTSYRYLLYGRNTLKILPVPSSPSDIIRVWYVPTFAALAVATDEVATDPIFDEYIEVCAAIQALEKEEDGGSTLSLKQDLAQLEDLVKRTAASRKEDQPKRIAIIQDDYAGLSGACGGSDNTNRDY